jgi:hypothetical protein
MENFTVLAISGCLLSALAVYVWMQFRRVNDQQAAELKLLKSGAELEGLQKKLKTYTQCNEFLGAAQQHLLTQAKLFNVQAVREYVILERYTKEKNQIATDVLLAVKCSVSYDFGLESGAMGFEVVPSAPGLRIKSNAPALLGTPQIKVMSHEVSAASILPDERAAIAQMVQKFAPLAQRYGVALTREDGVRVPFKSKLADGLRDFLAAQSGVQYVPCVTVDWR